MGINPSHVQHKGRESKVVGHVTEAGEERERTQKRARRRRSKADQDRSAARLRIFNQAKRKALLAACARVQTFLREFRRERVYRVHRAWAAPSGEAVCAGDRGAAPRGAGRFTALHAAAQANAESCLGK